jgi:signal transduction histidine kinase
MTRPPSRTAQRTSRIATLVVAGVSLAAAIAAIAIDLAVLPTHPDPPLSAGWSGVLPGVALLIPGCLLLWRLPWHPIAVVLAAFGALWVIDGLASAAVNLAWYTDRDAWWAAPAFWFFTRAGSVLILPVTLLLVLFPDGRLRRGAWRVVSIAAIGLGLVMPFAFVFAPVGALVADDAARAELLDVFGGWSLSLPLIPDAAWAALLAASGPCLMASLVLALVVCVSRRFGATAEQRAQLRWLLWSGLVFVAALAIFPFVPTQIVDVLLAATQGLIAASVVIAVTRYRLYAIDRLLSWTLVYAVLVAAIVAVDVLVLLAIGSAIDDRVAMLLSVIAVTVAYAPLRGRLFWLASRLVSGRRADPYGVVSSLGERLEHTPDAAARVRALAEAIAAAFGARFVRVELDALTQRGPALGGETDAEDGAATLSAEWGEWGERVAEVAVIPIEYAGDVIGRIEMEAGRRPIVAERDQRLLGDLVRFAAAAIRNAELGRDLQEIRERLVLAREAERSRLRRDLHDGLGPLLAGVKLRLETSRNLAARDPGRSLDLLDAAIDEQAEVIAEIRRIAHDLRPPALDDLGLVRAIEQTAERLSGGGLVVTVEGDPALPRELPAATEVAAFRIAAEALANARRHSGASRVTLRLSIERAGAMPGEGTGTRAGAAARAGGMLRHRMLRIEVIDDGSGVPPDAVPGVGLRSMRERAEELGGSLTLSPAGAEPRPDTAGTRVVALLPIGSAVAAPRPTPQASTDPEEAPADVRT